MLDLRKVRFATRTALWAPRFRIHVAFGALRVARSLNRVFAAVTAGSSRVGVPLAAAVVAFWLAKLVVDGRAEEILDAFLTGALYVLLVYVGLAVLRWVQKTRRLTTFEEFVDQTGSDLTPLAKALSVRVPVEFNRLDRLNHPVVETDVTTASVKNESYRSLRATVKAETVSTFLQSAVEPEATLGVGVFKVPLQALSRFAARVVQGPRITGAVMRVEDEVLVVAQMVGGERPESWQVRADLRASEDAAARSDAVGRELAWRIFTTLGREGRSTWRATAAFCDGMEAYRHYTYATSRERRNLYLARAERRFLDTLAADETYDLAYYNLGVVYSKLGRWDAAERALLRAVEHDPSDAAPFHMLARIQYFDRDRPLSAIEHAQRVISCTRDTSEKARAYDLRGLAERRLDRLDDAIRSRRKAVQFAWRALLAAELRAGHRGGATVFERELLSTCCRNLGVAYAYDADRRTAEVGGAGSLRRRIAHLRSDRCFKRARLHLKKALGLTRSPADLHFQLGRILLASGDTSAAVRELEEASRADPVNSTLAAQLASARAALWRDSPSPELEALVRDACERALETPSKVLGSEDRGAWVLATVANAYDTIAETNRANRVRTMPEVHEQVQSAPDRATLEALAARFREEGRDWAVARACYRLGVLALSDGEAVDLDAARSSFEVALSALTDHPGEIRELGLKALLATVHRQQRLYDEALEFADSAVELDPLSSYERNVLGEIHSDRGEHTKARDAFESALLLAPDDPKLHWNAGLACWNLAFEVRGKPRSANLRDAVAHFNQTLDVERDQQQRLSTHYWLGRLYAELGDHERAIPHFRFAADFPPATTLARYFLAEAHLEIEAYDDAVAGFRGLIAANGNSPEEWQGHVGTEIGDPSSVAAVVGWSFRGLAMSYLNRDVYLDAALAYAARAQDTAHLVDDEERTPLRAACASSKGQIFLKLGQTESAIRALEHSASLLSDDDTHLHLALAYEQRLQESRRRAERLDALRRAWAHTRLASRSANGDGSSRAVREKAVEVERRLVAWRATTGLVS